MIDINHERHQILDRIRGAMDPRRAAYSATKTTKTAEISPTARRGQKTHGAPQGLRGDHFRITNGVPMESL
ncbi:MAG: hypothetical protein ABSB22_26400, partial [Thermodesulfobacteriota bacterium]